MPRLPKNQRKSWNHNDKTLSKNLEVKDTTIRNLNLKIFDFEKKNVESKEQINVLKSKTNTLRTKLRIIT